MKELQLAALSPLRLAAQSMQHVFSSPWVPLAYTRFGRALAAVGELAERGTRRYEKPEFGIASTVIDGVTVAVREERALRTDFCDLLHFAHEGRAGGPRVLLVAPLSGHHATLLRGTVEAMLPDHDVYITDWIDARDIALEKGGFDLDDYIDLVVRFLHHLGPGAHVVAVCQPSVPVLAAVSLMAAADDPCQPLSMTLMGGPIDTRCNPTKVNEVATTRPFEWFERTVIHPVPGGYAGAGRRVYPGFLQLSGFMSLNLDRHYDAHVEFFRRVVAGDGDSAEQHRTFYDEYLSVMDLPAEFYLQTIRMVFQEHALARGTMTSRGRPIEPWRITSTALMTVEGGQDDITGLGQSRAAHQLCSSLPDSMRKHHIQAEVGHYGVFNGRRWRENIYPLLRSFIRGREEAVLAKQALGRDDGGGVGILVRRLWQMLPA